MQKDDLLATKVIMAANIFLISSKALVAFLTGSIGVVAVLADSCFDFLGGLFAYAGVKKGREPADFDHHFGHRKYEAVASIAQMGLVALAAAFIAIEAVRRLLDGAVLEISGADLAIMGITIGVDALLVAYLSKFANCKNPAIAASIGNYKSDILQNSLVLVGLFASSSGFSAADPIVALIVSMLMMRIALRVSNEAMGDITDQSPPAEKLEEYGKEIMKVRGVRSFHR
ncbi:MAG: cation diffusion facilitator family transporter, partial [Candidatus Anstonellaceae archaeon]